VRWDLIWVQWCSIYLTDDAFVDFFRRAATSLRNTPTPPSSSNTKNSEDGQSTVSPSSKSYVVMKENVLRQPNGEPVYDESDCSVTRSDSHIRRLFEK
jgi:protein N-terminal methyltransferase